MTREVRWMGHGRLGSGVTRLIIITILKFIFFFFLYIIIFLLIYSIFFFLGLEFIISSYIYYLPHPPSHFLLFMFLPHFPKYRLLLLPNTTFKLVLFGVRIILSPMPNTSFSSIINKITKFSTTGLNMIPNCGSKWGLTTHLLAV